MEPPFSRIGNVTIEKVSSDPKKNEDTKMNFSSDSSESDHLFSEDDHLDDKIPSQSPLDQSLSSTKRKNEFENLENIKKSKTSDNVAVSNELLTSEINFENLDNKSLDPVLRTNISDNEDTEYDSEDESDPEEPDPTSKLQAPKAVISTDNTDFIEKLSELGEPSKPDDTKIDSSDYDYDITEKLKEMGEISVQTVKKGEKPKKTEAEETENEISVMPAKKDPGSDSDDKLSSEKKIGNMRRNIREVMDETQLDEATLAAQRQEMERLRRVQEQQRIIREVQRQIALNRQNTKTQHRVISLLQGNSSLIKSFPGSSREGVASGSGGPSASGSSQGGPPPGKIGGTVLVKLPNGETKSMTRITKSGAPFDIVRLQKGALQGKVPRNLIPLKKGAGGNLTPSVSIAPVSKRIEPKIEPESDSESDFSDSEKKVRKVADVVTISSSSDDDCIVLSEDEPEEPEPDEDPCNSGMHTNDAYNVPDEQGRVLINVGHPENEAEIFLAPQIARVIKPHQIGGVRFLYDNVIESIDRFSTSTGFGCILAHSMGLGKTLQIVCFSDIFLRHTGAKTILCIMPINTLQNWMAEFNMWLPKDTANSPLLSHGEVRPRNFNIFVLNDSHKTLAARAKVIQEWHKDGGVLLIGYELYRLLSLRRNPKPKKKKKPIGSNPDRPETPEDEEKNKSLFEEIHEALVKPGPDLVICDEGHRIKNSHASISQALKQIRSKRRIVLTGYPLQNNLLEYWCMVDFVRPNYLGTKTEFSNMFERPIQNGQCIDSTPQDIRLMRYRAHVLHSLLEGFVQRRSHAVLQTSLPQKEEYVLLVRMTEFQRKLYDTFMNDVVRTKTVPNPLKAFAVCCKIWNHPDVLYHFLKKQTVGEAVDLDLEEVAGTVPGAATPTQTTPKKGSSRSKGGTKKEKKAAASKNAQKPAASVTPNTSATTTVSNTSSSTTTNTTTPNIQNIPAPTTFPAPQPIPQPNMSTSIPQNQNQNQMPQNVQNPQQNYQNMNQNYPNAPYPYPQQNYNYQQQNGDFYQNQGQQNYQNYFPNNYPNQEYNNFYPENKPEGYNMQQYQQPNDQQNYWQNNQQQQNQFYQHNGPQPQNDYYQQQNYQPQQQNQDYYRQNQYNQNNYQNFPQNNPYQQNQGWNPSEVKPEFPQNVEFSQDKDSKLENMDKKLHDLELGDEKMDEEKKDFDFKDDEEKEREVDIKNAEMMAAALIKKEDPGIPYDWAQELMKGYLPGCIENSAKMEIFFCILQESIALGDRILLFSQSLFTLNLIEEYLQCREVPGTTDKWAKGKQYYRLDGSTSALEREKLINEYNSNPNIHLFLVSTRAGSLGINLVGANRVIVFDASWNPCHDTQAVCRVYRYGQKKPCFVYRIVMDNCLEKKIYDRQINKQGMADRVVDECNPDAHLSMKDVTNLCWDDEKDSEVKDFSTTKDKYIDVVMQKVLDAYSSRLSKEPFQHESLLIDRKEKKLSQAEKRLAKRSYELEKQANINSRPTYSYYNSGSGQGLQIRAIRSADGSILQSKPVASVRPMQSENMTRDLGRPGGASGTGRSRWIPAEVWQRQGMTAQEMTLPLDVVIPTNSPDRGSIVLKAGQKVLVLKSPKGIYMQLECGKIVAIKTAFKVRGGKAPDKDNDGSKEPGAPTTILKKVPHANTSKSGGNVPLPLKNNTAITVIPKGGQQRLVKPFTHGGMKLNMRSIRQPVPNLVGRQVPMRLGGPRFTGKIQSIHRKVQLARAKPYNMDKNTFDPSKIKSEPQEPAEPEPHVVPSSDEEIHQESHKENLDKRSGSLENSECADLENYQSGETFSESEKSVENSDDFMGKDRRHSTESEKISNDSFAMDYQKIPHMSGGENKFPNPIEQSEPFIQHNMPHNPLNLPHNSSHMPTNPLNMPMNSPNMQHIPNMSHNPSNMPHNPPNMHNPLNISHNPPNMSHNPSNMPHNPQNMQQNPQNLPQNPPNMPQNPQNIPHNPPNMHNPPNIPHNPPNISHNPPNMPHNPSNMPHNPSNMPLNPPNIPHNPPNIPHNPPNLVPYSTVQPYPQNFDAYNMVDKVKPVLPTENVGEKSLPVPPLVETKKSTIQVQNMPQPISTAIVQESTNSRSLKNYRHNFAGQKTSKKPAATSSALHQLEQTTSAIGESKQPFQESLNNITNSYEAKNDENIIDLDDKPDDATDKNKSSGNKHSSPSLLKHFNPNPSNIQQNNSKTDIPHTVVPQHLNQPNPVPQTPHSLPGPPSQHPPPLVIPSQPPQALNQPPNPTNTQNAPPTQNQNPTEYPPNMGAYGGYYGYGPPNMGPPVQPYPPPPQGYYPNPDMSQFGERNKDKDKSTTGPAAAQNVSGPPRPDASQSTPDPPPVQTTPPAQTTPAISPTTPPVAPSPSANPPTPAGPPSSSNQPMTPNTTTASATPSAGTQPYGAPAGAPGAPAAPPAGGFPPYGQPGMPPPPHGGYDMMYGQQNQYGGNYPGLPYPNQPNYQPPYQNYDQNYPPATPGAPNMYSAFHRPEVPHYSDPYQYGRNYPPQYSYPPAGAPPANYPAAGYEYNYNAGGFAPPPPPFVAPPYNGMPNNNAVP